MKKRLLFFYRYLTGSRHFRLWRQRWITPQTLMVVGITATFMTTLAWSAPPSTATAPPAPAQAGSGSLQEELSAGASMQSGPVLQNILQQASVTPDSEVAPQEAASPDPNVRPTRTPLPAEYYANSNQTTGIILASAVLVLIVVIGVLMLLPNRDEHG
jgi:uncharacterized membrane protein (UPF0136 family)